jgi:hypothetical protein
MRDTRCLDQVSELLTPHGINHDPVHFLGDNENGALVRDQEYETCTSTRQAQHQPWGLPLSNPTSRQQLTANIVIIFPKLHHHVLYTHVSHQYDRANAIHNSLHDGDAHTSVRVLQQSCCSRDSRSSRRVRSHVSSVQQSRNRVHLGKPPEQTTAGTTNRDIYDQRADDNKPSEPSLPVGDDNETPVEHITASRRSIEQDLAHDAHRTSRNSPLLALHLCPQESAGELGKLMVRTGLSFPSICVRVRPMINWSSPIDQVRNFKPTWPHTWDQTAVPRTHHPKARSKNRS